MNSSEPQEQLRNEPIGWVLVAFASMLWGSDLLLRPKVLAAGMGSVSVVLFEHLALVIIFVPILIRSRKTWTRLSLKEWGGLLIIAWGGSGLATVLLTQAYAYGEPVTATLLQKLQPCFAIALAAPMLGERPKPMFFVSFAVALLGAYLMSFGLAWVTDPASSRAFSAAGFAVGAAALWGASTVIGRRTLGRVDPFTVAGLRFTLALPLLVVWNLLLPGPMSAKFSVSPAALLPLLAIVLLPDAIGMALYYVGLKRTIASLATLAELAYPATALLLAYPSTKDFSFWRWAGVGLLVLSLIIIRSGNFVRAPQPAGG